MKRSYLAHLTPWLPFCRVGCIASALLITGLCSMAAPADKPSVSATNEIYVVPFSHLDLMWGGTREECLSRGSRIISKAIQLAQRQGEFRFLLEDEVFVANYVEAHRGSQELEQLKRLVREDRIELAPKWAGIYQNLPRGEALVRNIIYGKQYARDVFGVDPQVYHPCDIPGFTEQLPQILSKSGIPFMVMTRMGPPDCSLFRYRAPDSSTTLVWNTINGYGWGVGLKLHRPDLVKSNFTSIGRSIGKIQATTQGPIYVGWGTDLFSPSENLAGNMSLLTERLAPLQFRLATPSEFFHAAAQGGEVPTLSGEVPSSWGNLLTSMCHLWPPTTQAADTLISAEKFAAINYSLGYADYPKHELESLWKCAIETMDHNNFGQGGDIGDARKLEYAATATMRGGEILRQMLRNIAERIRSPFPRSTPVVVFNPLSWTRDDVVRAHVSIYGDVVPGDTGDYQKGMRLVDETGAAVPFHVEQSYGTVSRAHEIVFVARGVPSMGYKTYFMVPAAQAEVFPNAGEAKFEDSDGKSPKRVLGTNQVENEYYRVTVDRVTGRVTIFDKELDRIVARDLEMVGVEERGGNSLALEPLTGRAIINTINRVELEENNPVSTVVRIDGDLAGVAVSQKISLHRGIKRVDLENTVDWKQGRLMKIEQYFPCAQAGADLRYGTPYGSVAGSDVLPNSGPRSGDEIPRDEWKHWRQIQDWIFAGTADWGVTLCADRQLVRVDEDGIRVGMLRGTYSTTGFTRGGKSVFVQVPPVGKYVFRYSLSSGKRDWAAARSYRTGMAFSNPMIPVGAHDELSTKSLPPTRSFCSLSADNLVVTALKQAERDQSMVLRVVEMEGRLARARVEYLGSGCDVQPLNLLEEQTPAAKAAGWEIRPYEITTLRLPAKRGQE
jgi:alpha-mannosidase